MSWPWMRHDVVCFWPWALSLLLQTFLIPSLWCKFIMVSCVQRVWFWTTGDFYKAILVFPFLNVTSRLHLVVNPLCLHSWRFQILTKMLLPQSMLDFCSCCEVFLHQRNGPVIIVWSHLPAFFSPAVLHFISCIEISLDFISVTPDKQLQVPTQYWYPLQTFNLLYLSWSDEGMDHNWPFDFFFS